jgi:membrane protease subunit HflC
MKQMLVCIGSAVIVLLVVISTVFNVNPGHRAIVSSPNHATLALAGPGLHLKLPPPLQVVTPVDMRAQTFSLPEAVRCVTADKASLLVTPVIYYRVNEPLKLFAATKGAPGMLPDRLVPLAHDALVATFSHHAFSHALAQQPDIARAVRDAMKAGAAPLGVEVLDVEFTRVDYPHMNAGQARQQAQAAHNGSALADAATTHPDNAASTAAVPLTPFAQARKIRDDADAQAVAIVAQAGMRDPAFYQFWQRMQTYRTGVKPGDVMVVNMSNANAASAASPSLRNQAPADSHGSQKSSRERSARARRR